VSMMGPCCGGREEISCCGGEREGAWEEGSATYEEPLQRTGSGPPRSLTPKHAVACDKIAHRAVQEHYANNPSQNIHKSDSADGLALSFRVLACLGNSFAAIFLARTAIRRCSIRGCHCSAGLVNLVLVVFEESALPHSEI
jgi:hypothetical protein